MRRLAKMFALFALLCTFSMTTVFAAGIQSLDELTPTEQTDQQSDASNTNPAVQPVQGEDSNSVADYLQGYTPITNENMQQASKLTGPLVNAIGTIAGAIVALVSALLFIITALDLAYIALPPIRSILNPAYGAADGRGGGMMGGMGMGGMGMGGYGRRGYGMGGMMGGGMQGGMPPESGLRRRWVSDEAVACVNLSPATDPQGGGVQGMPMMGGMGAMGQMQMGGAMQQMPTKSVIFAYLKKRSFFLIVFAIATIVLMSSIFTDCGINLAALLVKILNRFNGQIANANF